MEGALVLKMEVSAIDKEQKTVLMLRSCLPVLGSNALGRLDQGCSTGLSVRTYSERCCMSVLSNVRSDEKTIFFKREETF